jgi:uncharacterized protein
MKIALIGASGKIGSRILAEAIARGHAVTGIVRKPETGITLPNLTWAKADVLHTDELAELIRGHDAVISAFGIDWLRPETYPLYGKAADSIIRATKKAGVKRLINVGGAGSLEAAPGVQIVDTPEFPAMWKAGADEQRKSLEIFRQEKNLDWTFFSPALVIEPGEKKGGFRIGKDNPVFDEKGNSHISYDDYASALLDELENPQFIKQRFTVGYK